MAGMGDKLRAEANKGQSGGNCRLSNMVPDLDPHPHPTEDRVREWAGPYAHMALTHG